MFKKFLVISCICLAVLGCSDDENDAKKHGVFDVYLQPIDRAELKDQQQQQQTEQHKQQPREQQSK